MKTKKLLLFIMSIVMCFSLLQITAFAASDKVSEVTLTISEPRAGENVNLDFSSVGVHHHMTYKVVGLRWYKQGDNRQMGVESGADTYFIGGQSYTVEIDLEVKSGNSGWNFEYEGVDTDYSGINATINGKNATVKYPPLNSDKHKTITVAYDFNYIADGIINYPSVSVPTPIAGNEIPLKEALVLGNPRATWIASTGYNWSVYENKAWRKMELNETFVAGARYKVEFYMQANEGFVFNLEEATDLRNDGNKHIWGYINGNKRSMTLQELGVGLDGEMQYNDAKVFVEYEFTSCEAQYVDSVSFSGIQAPSATQHPQYVAPTMGSLEYSLITDEEITGGAEYNFVNGIQWTSTNGILNQDSVFEQGEAYSMIFFVKTIDTHRFTDWVEASADIGYVDVLTLYDDPTIAMITISFAPCDGGVLNEVNVSGVRAPVHGETPDYEFIYGQGYDKGTSEEIVWYDLTDSKKVLSTDTFEYGHKYELRIILRSEKQMLGASTGKFEFAPHDSLTVNINGKPAEKLAKYNGNPEENWVEASISFDCEKAIISEVLVTVESPAEGNSPAQQLTKGSDIYNVDGFMFVDSETDNILNVDDIFEPQKNYRFVLLVSPTNGYTFDENVTLARVNGMEASVIYADESGALISTSFIADEAPYCLITFNANGGDGQMSDIILKGSMLFILPECEFEAPEGMHFIGWSADFGETILSGVSYYLDGIATLTLMAVYEDDEHHEHIYSPNFNASDEFSHYKTCVSPTCPEFGSYSTMSTAPGDYMNHQFDNDCDDTCDDCGYVRTTNNAGDPLHFYEHACSEVCPNCGQTREAEPHTPGAAATCTEAQICTVCNKVLEDAKGHTPGAEADCGHDQTCTVCGEVLVEASGNHTPGAESTCTKAQTCTVCGEELNAILDHVPGMEWITDENSHHKLCGCGQKVELGTHADTNGDEVCDVCGYDMSTGLAGWAIALIIIGAIVVLGGGGFCLYWFVIKKKISK